MPLGEGAWRGSSTTAASPTHTQGYVCITIIDTIILHIHTNDAYIFDTFINHCCEPNAYARVCNMYIHIQY
jgi:hypothetical protein